MSDEQPKDAARRIFAKQELRAFDVIERCATDPRLVVRTLLQLVAETPPGGRVCELGFGSGWLLEEMARELSDRKLHGLDMSAQYTRAAHDRYGDLVRILRGDMDRLPFADASFDTIATCWTLYFINDIDATLREIKRCVRPGGRVIAATIAPENMIEYAELAEAAIRSALPDRAVQPDVGARFDTDTGAPYMERNFDRVEYVDWSGELIVSSLEDALALWHPYGDSDRIIAGTDLQRVLDVFASNVPELLARDGEWRLTRHSGVFVATV